MHMKSFREYWFGAVAKSWKAICLGSCYVMGVIIAGHFVVSALVAISVPEPWANLVGALFINAMISAAGVVTAIAAWEYSEDERRNGK